MSLSHSACLGVECESRAAKLKDRLFIIEGVATVVFSIGAFFVLPDYPTTTKWLTAEEKELAVTRLMSRGEEAEEGDDMTHREALWAAVKDVKIWTFMLGERIT